MITRAEVESKLSAHLAMMQDWAEGRRSWTNLGPHEPYTPDVIAIMDTQEVAKHSAAVQAYAALLVALT
jgi:hypothetical protein